MPDLGSHSVPSVVSVHSMLLHLAWGVAFPHIHSSDLCCAVFLTPEVWRVVGGERLCQFGTARLVSDLAIYQEELFMGGESILM